MASGRPDSGRKKPRRELAQGLAKRCLSWTWAPRSFGPCDSDRGGLRTERYKHLPQEWGQQEPILQPRPLPTPHTPHSPTQVPSLGFRRRLVATGSPAETRAVLGSRPFSRKMHLETAGLLTCCTTGPDLSDVCRVVNQKGGVGTVANRRTDLL